MKKINRLAPYFIALLFIGTVFQSCKKDELVSEDSKPSWLGESIYGALSNPTNLEGTFNTYLRLIDDLDYAEVLSKTGSKTIFPANDEAFARFFAGGNNKWNVTDYSQLTTAMKKQLLYGSMLDNALLLGMLPNTSNGSLNEVVKGNSVKHASNISVIDTITSLKMEDFPAGNTLWSWPTDMLIVSDATSAPLVHFTREQMINNGITTTPNDTESDFAILTGEPYVEEKDADGKTKVMAFAFRNKIINGDVTCQNGYIHQVEDVLVPPGNMAEVLRNSSNTQYFSRMLDYFSAPYYDATTTNEYNSWARSNGYQEVSKIFERRYLSTRSHTSSYQTSGNSLSRIPDPNGEDNTKGTIRSNSEILDFDPGWNGYYPNVSGSSADVSIADMGAIFVPTDDVVWDYFKPAEGGNASGPGYVMLKTYGAGKGFSRSDLPENLDSLYAKKPTIIAKILKNLMQASFNSSVPSKFEELKNDAGEVLGVTKESLVEVDGKKDVRVANNGVIYMINKFIAPDEFESVMAPTSFYPNMKIMNVFVNDRSQNGNASVLGADMYFYLLAMKANYAFFIPTDEAFETFIVDPTSLQKKQPQALRFVYDEKLTGTTIKVRCYAHEYNPQTGEIGPQIGESVKAEEKKTLIQDLLNYHTVVLNEGEDPATNNYHLTKHGGAIRLSFHQGDSLVYGGLQNDGIIAPAKVTADDGEKNGHAYTMNAIIQPTVRSVYSVLSDTEYNGGRFSKFLNACEGFGGSELMEWAGISSEKAEDDVYSPFQRYQIFEDKDKKCLDYNVRFMSAYHYTLYAPNNDAMTAAENQGLPTWDQIEALYAPYQDKEGEDVTPAEETAKAQALEMINTLRSFVRYHFQANSIFADNKVAGDKYQSLLTDELGIAKNIEVNGSENGKLYVTDCAGTRHLIDANNSGMMTNVFARDYLFDKERTSATAIATSSFAIIHEMSEVMDYNNKVSRYDNAWKTAAAKANLRNNYKAAVVRANNIKD